MKPANLLEVADLRKPAAVFPRFAEPIGGLGICLLIFYALAEFDFLIKTFNLSI